MSADPRLARTVVPALRLDRWTHDHVRRRAERALELGVGGFVLFGGEAEAVARLVEEIREAAGEPLWIASDLERGAGQQFRGAAELPPPAALAAHPEPEAAVRRAGALTGREAAALGVNWVLAPVLDLDVEPANPIVATRSFGADPAVVGRLGGAWIEGCQSAGVAACAKHFPGHGRTRADSHVELPRVEARAGRLADDLAAFREVVGTVASVMVAHVAYPGLGCTVAATRCATIVKGLLRDQLGFDGPAATDAMIMAGAGEDDAAAAVDAVRAGCDLILYPSDPEATVRALEEATGAPGFEARVREALRRGERALRGLAGPGGEGAVPGRPPRAQLELSELEAEAGDRLFEPESGRLLALARETILDRTRGCLRGWDAGARTEVRALSDDPEAEAAAEGREAPPGAFGDAFARALAAEGWRTVRERESKQRVVLLAATPRGWKGRAGLSEEVRDEVAGALAGADRALLVLFGHPRLLEAAGGRGICAWSTEAVMQRAAASWLDRAVRESARASTAGGERADASGRERAEPPDGAPPDRGSATEPPP